MGATTGITWARSTRNFWSGCTKVGPGCDACYAEASSRRMRGVNEVTLQAMNWGPGAARVDHKANADKDVRKWDELCKVELGGGRMVKLPKEKREPGKMNKVHQRCFTEGWPHPGFWPVFINSYSDTFDNEVDQLWRDLLFTTMEDCPHLTFEIVTKRVGNVLPMLGGRWDHGKMPKNIWILITVVNQDELDRDGPKLLAIAEQLRPSVIGLSIEPQLGPMDVSGFLDEACKIEQVVWGIVGGESAQPGHPARPAGHIGGRYARPFDLQWGLDIADEFAVQGQPFFFKQAGSNVMLGGIPYGVTEKGAVPEEWPSRLRVQQFPKWSEKGETWLTT